MNSTALSMFAQGGVAVITIVALAFFCKILLNSLTEFFHTIQQQTKD